MQKVTCAKCGNTDKDKFRGFGSVWRLAPGEKPGGKMIEVTQLQCKACGHRVIPEPFIPFERKKA